MAVSTPRVGINFCLYVIFLCHNLLTTHIRRYMRLFFFFSCCFLSLSHSCILPYLPYVCHMHTFVLSAQIIFVFGCCNSKGVKVTWHSLHFVHGKLNQMCFWPVRNCIPFFFNQHSPSIISFQQVCFLLISPSILFPSWPSFPFTLRIVTVDHSFHLVAALTLWELSL